MPLTRCSRASWSTSGLAVLPGRRDCRLGLGGGLVATGVRGVALGRGTLGRGALAGPALGRAALACGLLGGGVPGDCLVLGLVVLGGGVLSCLATGGRLARLALILLGFGGLAVPGLTVARLGVASLALDLEVLDGLGDRRGERFLLVRPRRGGLQGALGTGQALELLPVAGDLQKAADRIGRLRPHSQPVLGTLGVDLDQGRFDLGVILAYLLDRPAVPLGAGVGDDDPVKRRTDLAHALELDLDSHG